MARVPFGSSNSLAVTFLIAKAKRQLRSLAACSWIYGIAILFVLPSSAKFIKHLSNKNSFDGIWLLTFIIYKFTADCCFRILRCEKVDGYDGLDEYVSMH